MGAPKKTCKKWCMLTEIKSNLDSYLCDCSRRNRLPVQQRVRLQSFLRRQRSSIQTTTHTTDYEGEVHAKVPQ